MKRSSLKRGKSNLKRSPLRKRSKSKATIDIADRKLQDWYRFIYRGTRCEVCGAPFNVMHHHLLKSQSNAGRYEHNNLIFICFRCHSALHFGDNNIVATYSIRRGEEWIEKMKKLKQVKKQYYTKRELEEIIKGNRLGKKKEAEFLQ